MHFSVCIRLTLVKLGDSSEVSTKGLEGNPGFLEGVQILDKVTARFLASKFCNLVAIYVEESSSSSSESDVSEDFSSLSVGVCIATRDMLQRSAPSKECKLGKYNKLMQPKL